MNLYGFQIDVVKEYPKKKKKWTTVYMCKRETGEEKEKDKQNKTRIDLNSFFKKFVLFDFINHSLFIKDM